MSRRAIPDIPHDQRGKAVGVVQERARLITAVPRLNTGAVDDCMLLRIDSCRGTRHVVCLSTCGTPMSATVPLDQITARVRAEFREMPGLRLTVPQLQRLCGLDPTVCSQVVDALLERSVISRRGAVFFLTE